MFVSQNQIFVFIACLSFGTCFGFLFSLAKFIKYKIKNLFLRIVPDVIAFLLLSRAYVGYSYSMNFPNFRIYMVIGVVLGVYIYLKTFHIILAKYVKMAYNIIDKKQRNKKSKDESR